MRGRLVLVGRLLGRDLRRRRGEAVLLVLAIAAATATMTLGLTLRQMVADPYRQTRVATAGPDLVAEPALTGQEALDALAPLVSAPGVTGHSGPFPVAYLTLTTPDKTVRVVVEGRDRAPAAIDQPAVTEGTWVRPGGVVLERAFADAVGVRVGDTVGVDGHAVRVDGIAITAARAVFPSVGWHLPRSILVEAGGLAWADRGDLAGLAGAQEPSYMLKLRLADPAAAGAFRKAETSGDAFRGGHVRTWQDVAEDDDRQSAPAVRALTVGSWLLGALAMAGVGGIVTGRVIARRRRVGLLKAVGAGPGLIAAVHLAEYLVIGLGAAAVGLGAGWAAGPVLFRPDAGFIGTVGAHPPLRIAGVALGVALAIAVAATAVPVVRAATAGTTWALADAAAEPRRRGWHVWLSRRLPAALLIGVRINARRPHRARLVTLNTFCTAAVLGAMTTNLAQTDGPVRLGVSTVPDARDARVFHALLIVVILACLLALLNTTVSTWTAVLDARRSLAVARALGATPGQAGAGLAVAQLLPAVPGVALGVPFGSWLYLFFSPPNAADAPGSWLLATGVAVLLTVAALTAVPALATARGPVGDALR